MLFVVLRKGIFPELVGPFLSEAGAKHWHERDCLTHGPADCSVLEVSSPQKAWEDAELAGIRLPPVASPIGEVEALMSASYEAITSLPPDGAELAVIRAIVHDMNGRPHAAGLLQFWSYVLSYAAGLAVRQHAD